MFVASLKVSLILSQVTHILVIPTKSSTSQFKSILKSSVEEVTEDQIRNAIQSQRIEVLVSNSTCTDGPSVVINEQGGSTASERRLRSSNLVDNSLISSDVPTDSTSSAASDSHAADKNATPTSPMLPSKKRKGPNSTKGFKADIEPSMVARNQLSSFRCW